MTHLTIVTQNEVSIICENPLFINDSPEGEKLRKEIIIKEFDSKNIKTKNRSVNIVRSAEI
ncbi:MAG: hypothetical protein JSS63_03735 [Bacteroidetes bacterium]|nr:hypothetical protein [Bacteroidota bacterium]MBX7047141.1 hypothetical protein [Ignavibacteria bacterium]